MDELKHYGIPGQKWGQRRWQNEDGSFNEEGKKRYGRIGNGIRSLRKRRLTKAYEAGSRDASDLRAHGYRKEARAVQKVADRNKAKANKIQVSPSNVDFRKIGKAAAITALAAVGVVGISHVIKNERAYTTISKKLLTDRDSAEWRRWLGRASEDDKKFINKVNESIKNGTIPKRHVERYNIGKLKQHRRSTRSKKAREIIDIIKRVD